MSVDGAGSQPTAVRMAPVVMVVSSGDWREVDRAHGAGLGAGAAERAGLQVDRALDAAVVELRVDRLAVAFGVRDLADGLAGAATDTVAGDDVGQATQ